MANAVELPFIRDCQSALRRRAEYFLGVAMHIRRRAGAPRIFRRRRRFTLPAARRIFELPRLELIFRYC